MGIMRGDEIEVGPLMGLSGYGTCQRIQDTSAYTVRKNGPYRLSREPKSDQTRSVCHQPKGYRAILTVHVFPAGTFREKGVY
jgi:hypothetical protein